jgi:hypothetical protein
MKKLLLLLTLATNIQAQDGSFSGTVFDLDSGRIQVINGSFDNSKPEETVLEAQRRINAENAEADARLRAQITESEQLFELKKQTRLLQEIADK